MEKKIDLHIHTTMSDGALSPREVIDKAYDNGVRVMSITDHDTIDAYTDSLFEYARSKNITLIPGVEISTKIEGYSFHVLGYNYDLDDTNFRNKLKELKTARHTYLHEVSAKLTDLGYIVNTSKLDKIESVTKAHIANDIITNKENNKKLMSVFNRIPDKALFIETIMNKGCPGYVKKLTIDPKEAVQLIRSAHGKAILAHPVAYDYEEKIDMADIKRLIDYAGFDAIEGVYLYIDRFNNKINNIAKWINFANKNKLYCSIGSDFHYEDDIHPDIGFKNEKLSIDDNFILEILNYINEKN